MVVQELTAHRRRDLVDLDKRATALDKDHQRLVGTSRSNLSPSPINRHVPVDRLCDQYRDDVVQWFEEAGAVLSDPSVSHSELVDRILAHRRPFTSDEKGYRDALIWYSVLERADDEPVVLLTANTKDFASKPDNALAPELQDDLTARGLPKDRVTLLTSTGDLLNRVLPQAGEHKASAAWSLFAATAPFAARLDDWVDERLEIPFSAPPSSAPSWLFGIGVRSIDTVDDVVTTRFVDDGDGWYRVHARLSGTGRIGGYGWRWGDPDAEIAPFTLWDEWNGITEYYASTNLIEIEIDIAARWRPLTHLDSVEIVDVNPSNAPAGDPDEHRRARTIRAMRCLRAAVKNYAEDPAFVDDVQTNVALVAGVLRQWEVIADTVPGHYPALAVDNLDRVIEEPAGLRAMERQLTSALLKLENRDSCR